MSCPHVMRLRPSISQATAITRILPVGRTENHGAEFHGSRHISDAIMRPAFELQRDERHSDSYCSARPRWSDVFCCLGMKSVTRPELRRKQAERIFEG